MRQAWRSAQDPASGDESEADNAEACCVCLERSLFAKSAHKVMDDATTVVLGEHLVSEMDVSLQEEQQRVALTACGSVFKT